MGTVKGRLLSAFILALTCVGTQPVFAQAYPSKPVRFIVAFAPGGPADIIGRLVGQKLGDSWGQTVVVENRPGAGGSIATGIVAKSPADGYTVLVNTSSLAVNVSLLKDASFDVEKDLIPVITIASSPNLIVASPASGLQTLADAIALGRKSGLPYGTAGIGTTPHLTAEYLFKVLAKVDATHIAYKGAAPALSAAMGGEIPIASVAMPPAVPMVKGGKLRGLAVTSSKRVPTLPDVPTVAESGFPGFEDYTWVGLFLPAGSPAEAADRLHAEVAKIIETPDFKKRLAEMGFEPVGGSRQAFVQYLRKEIDHWGKVVRETGAKPE